MCLISPQTVAASELNAWVGEGKSSVELWQERNGFTQEKNE